MVNRRLGGVRAAVEPLQEWITRRPDEGPIRIIDLGTGSGDIPAAIARWAGRAGRRVEIVAVDSNPVTLALAREHVGTIAGIELVEADARELVDAYGAASFDYAHAGMFLHHLDDIEVMTVLRVMDRLTRHGLIWNDLVRGPVPALLVRALVVGRPHMVRHDATASVAAGFTKREALELAERVGLPEIRYRRHLFGRFVLTSEKGKK